MGLSYQAVGWNRQKKVYDATLGALIALYLAAFAGATLWLHPGITAETLLLRALGTAALLLLHVVLAIGPLCRLDRRFLPLLYNRRHLGVTTFLLGLGHGGLALFQFHALGDLDPLASLLAGHARWGSLADFPFQPLGLAALAILFLMAATSHDFWLVHLTAPVWKALHMGVYLAYALLLGHVALGVLQQETSPLLAAPVAAGGAALVTLHLAAAWRERRLDRALAAAAAEGFVPVCDVDEIPERRARGFFLGGERVAVFRYDGKLSAISGVCQHQNGPLAEGRILDGCVTCPWHGYQYLPESGAAPAPFSEKIPSFRVRLAGRRVLVDPRPLPPGTPVPPVELPLAAVGGLAGGTDRGSEGSGAREGDTDPGSGATDGFFVGWLPSLPPGSRRAVHATVLALAALALGLAGLLARGQSDFAASFFEWDRASELVGTLDARPLPLLWVERPGDLGAAAPRSGYPLVAPGKHGATDLVMALTGQRVRLQGKAIHRDGTTMLELVPGSLAPAAGAAAGPPAGRSLGQVTLRGEIVDSKCFLGVMKPGEGRVHRECAVRCISGGVPPALWIRDAAGGQALVLLVAADGGSLSPRILDLVAEPTAVTGELLAYDDLLVLRADPAAIQRLPAGTSRGSDDG